MKTLIWDSGGFRGRGVKMKLAVVVVMYGLAVASSAIQQNCSFEASTETLVCSVSVLKAQPNATMSMASANRADGIKIECDNAEQESILRTNHFGYLPNLQKLELDYCKLRQLPSLAFSGLPGLHSLVVNSRNAEWSSRAMEIQSDALTGLNDLRALNLSQNNIWTLPRGLFCSLGSLATLNLSSNHLQDLTELGFSSADVTACQLPLHTLDLSHNSFSQLPTSSFGQLRRVQHLNLADNNLIVIEDAALQGLSTLTTLNLAHNQLVALPPAVFAPTQRLQELRVENNSLSSLSPGLFHGLEYLVVLNLSRNDISSEWLTAKTFSSLMRLVALDLSHNKLTSLHPGLLRPLTTLQLLDVSHNQLKTLSGGTFLSQYNLHILRLSHNEIEELDSSSLSGLSVLGSLSLDNNNLRYLDETVMQNCTGLIDLELQKNRLHRVPSRALSKLVKLETLDLGENGIANLDGNSLKGLSNVYALRLAGNGIKNLEAEVFAHVSKIRVLNLADNDIGPKLDQNLFSSMKKLRMLRLDKNNLEDINGIIASISELKWLNVSTNRLPWFDYAFIPKGLEWLDISNNAIEDLGNYYKMKGPFSLRTLIAKDNRIKKLESLSLPSSLEVVDLKSNKIRTVAPSTFQNKSNLRSADLSSNLIKLLQLPSLAINSRGRTGSSQPEVFLSHNPFLCNCEMEWLQKINQMTHEHLKYPRVMDMEDIECRIINRHNETVPVTRSIVDIGRDEFLCQYQAHCFALCKCCDFFACDCRMQCPQGCSCFHDSTWSGNIIQCSNRGHLGIPPLIPMDATTIYLDGNNFTGTLESQAFIGRKRVRELFLNHTQIGAINNQTFNGLTELELLHLDHNLIEMIEGYEFGNLTSLLELHLQNNLIQHINSAAFTSLSALQVLRLEGNRLSNYPVWHLQALPSLLEVTLSENPWSCQCDFVHKFQDFASSKLIADLSVVECRADHDEEVTVNLSENVTCSDAMAVTYQSEKKGFLFTIIPLIVGVVAISIVLLCSTAMVFVFRTPLRVWLHSKYGIRVLDACGKAGQDKLYDAFVSYSDKDEDFVQQVLVPQMEQDEPAYKLCLQKRDMPSTSSIADTFPGIAQLCAKHILVVSRHYLESEWCQIKFAMQEPNKLKPVIILLEELTTLELAATPEFNLLLKTHPSVKWTEAGFWNKLRFYLPDPRLRAYKRSSNGSTLHANSPKPGTGPLRQQTSSFKNGGWHYDGLLHSNNSSTSTRSTTLAGANLPTGSPRALSAGESSHSSGTTGSSSSTEVVTSSSGGNRTAMSAGNVVSNPLASFSQIEWPGQQQQHRHHQHQQDHTYQTIADPLTEPIYHTLEPSNAAAGMVANNNDDDLLQNYDTVGKLDVMLPNGQFVPATLVRNNHNGRLVPLVEVDSRTMPPQQQQQQQQPHHLFSYDDGDQMGYRGKSPRTSNRTSGRTKAKNNGRHFV